jgi:Tfp pilus assembly protein PilN
VRAVNLVPEDERAGAGGVAGRSGGAVYVVLGALAVLVVLAGAWALTNRQVADRRAQLEQVRAETATARARAGQLAAYARFATLSRERSATVRRLVAGRFDWASTLREVARVVPADVTLGTLSGSTGRSAGAPGPAPAPAPAAPAGAGSPSLELVGCTRSQAEVALLLARLRAIDGARRVTLVSSEKGDGGGADGACGSVRGPRFTITVAFAAPGAATAGAPAGATTPAPSAPAPSGAASASAGSAG